MNLKPRFIVDCLFQSCPRLLLNNHGVQALGVLDVDGLNVAVELLLGTLLVVTSARDSDPDPVCNTLDTLLPDLLVQLGVDADVGGALRKSVSRSSFLRRRTARIGRSLPRSFEIGHTIAWVANFLISLMALGCRAQLAPRLRGKF